MTAPAWRKFALVGCGRIGKRHAEIIASKANLLAVCDVVEARAVEYATLFSARPYTSLAEMLQHEPSVEVCVICTPNGLHAEQAILCLQNRKHVLCEKPMAISTEDCQRMIHAAEGANRILSVVKQNRFNPPVVALKKAIDEGRLGRILSVQLNCFWNRTAKYYRDDWRGTLQWDGGTLFTQFSHFIDLLPWMIGDVEKASAVFANQMHQGIIEFEDTGSVWLTFDNGALGSIHYTVNSHHKNMEGSMVVFGEKGTVKIGGAYLNVLEYQDIENYTLECLPFNASANQYGHYEGSMSNHEAVYDNLLSVLEQGGDLVADMYDGLRTVSVIEKIYQSRNVS